jgi:hypothetical protein
MVALSEIKTNRVVLIDLDTGTVLGRNVVVAYLPEYREEEVTSSDSAAIDFGNEKGQPLYFDADESTS